MNAPIPERTLQAVGKLARLLWHLVRDSQLPVTAKRANSDWEESRAARSAEKAQRAGRQEASKPPKPYEHPIYLVTGARKDEEQKHPEALTKAVRRGLKDRLCCDDATACLVPMVRLIITSLDSSASVEWLCLYPRPNFAIIERLESDVQDMIHSVIRITLGTGKIFILDLTGSQYGHSSARVYAWQKYKKDFVARRKDREGARWFVDKEEELEARWVGYRAAFADAYKGWIDERPEGEQWWREVGQLSEAQQEQHFQRCVDLAKERIGGLGPLFAA